MTPAFPTLHFLAPDPPAVAPDGFTRLRHAITGGLPHAIPLDATVRLILALPTGQVRLWTALDPQASISRSTEGRAPRPDAPLAAAGAALERAPLRLVAVRGAVPIGVVPLVAGPRFRLPSNPAPGVPATLELALLSWDIRAGNARGPGDFGAFIELAWRRADRSSDRFDVSVVPPAVAARLAAEDRQESWAAGTKASGKYDASDLPF